jgi:hypothetical protein
MPGRRARHVQEPRRVVDAVALAVVLVVAALAFVSHFESDRRRATGDTYYYLSQSLEFAGVSSDEARAQAGEVVCAEVHRLHVRNPTTADCTRYVVNPPRRYLDIFTSRPGWPILGSPFVGLLGAWWGAVVATFLLALLAAALVHAALRQVTGPVPAAAGAMAFSLLGTGTWAAWLLPEGAVFACTALALLGATRCSGGDRRGLYVAAVALVLAYACKPANGAALSASLLAAGLVLAALPGRRPRPAVLAGVGAAGLAGWALVSRLAGLPSLEDTLQDLATRHYALPDVPHPYLHLRDVNEQLWTGQVDRWLGIPQPLPLILAACLVAVLTLGRAGVLWAVVALSAVGIVALHPLVSQYDRLIAPAWLAVCAAVAGIAGLLGSAVRSAARSRWTLPRPRTLSTRAVWRDRHDRQRRTVGVGAPQEDS